ncbi:MAG TPA: ABC transporter permease subunit [Thermoanaerobaculia bacterium]|nr:ABC transporter permease subunit [Thermoanaerobaculia bacterium]
MRLFRAFVAHELRTQLRSRRFQLIAAVYVLVVSAVPVVMALSRSRTGIRLGAGNYAAATFLFAPLLTALVAALLSVDGINRERDEGSLSIVAIAPLSNAGYILRRWGAMNVVLLPLSLAPVLVAFTTSNLAGAPVRDLSLFLWPWLIQVVPLCLAATAFAIGLGTITGRTIVAGMAAVLIFALFDSFGNDILGYFGHRIDGIGEWLNLYPRSMGFVASLFNQNLYLGLPPGSDAPYDPGFALGSLIPRAATGFGLAALFGGLGCAFLRRTRADLHPWRVSEKNQLRTYIGIANRIRENYSPDPGLALPDFLLILAGLLIFAASIGLIINLDSWFRGRARERYNAEISGLPQQTPISVQPRSWRIDAEITGPTLRSRVTGVMINSGSRAESHLSFMLNPTLRVVSSEVEGRRTMIARAWDRLALDIDPPLQPTETCVIHFNIAGTPSTIDFAISRPPFVTAYETLMKAVEPWDLADMSRSKTGKLIQNRRIRLEPTDLTPVPRYTTLQLTPPSTSMEVIGRLVPEERFSPRAHVAYSIRVPRRIMLAGPCGGISRPSGNHAQLDGDCQLFLSDMAILGGPWTPVEMPGVGVALVLAPHVEDLKRLAPLWQKASELAGKYWPRFNVLQSAVVVETVPEIGLNGWAGQDYFDVVWESDEKSRSTTHGKVIEVPELVLRLKKAFPAETVAREALTGELMRRRLVPAEQQLFFRRFYRVYAERRLRGGRRQGAVMTGNGAVRIPILTAEENWSPAFNVRLPAAFLDLEHRLGARRIDEAIESIVSDPSEAPFDARALFEVLGARSGVPLERFYSDFIAGSALPELSLEDVIFAKTPDGWDVRGKLHNLGTGESLCQIVLRTDLEPVSSTIRLDSGQSNVFVLHTRYRPQVLQVDPDRVCFRWRAIGDIDRVEYKGEK